MNGKVGRMRWLHLRFQLGHSPHGFFNWCVEIDSVRIIQVNRINAEILETGGASLLAVFGRGVDVAPGAVLHKAKLGGEEDVVTLPGPLEPLPEQHLIVAVQATNRARCK
jgi:hypothetical protein